MAGKGLRTQAGSCLKKYGQGGSRDDSCVGNRQKDGGEV